ncbi:MAG TPA: LysR family transcriptional regulator [Bryobacteraceae bacterium]|nr:LysR family transcriptional regulator [Bryobacteraceae bacterium]
MGLWEFRLFKEIATSRSMSKGATSCGVSQSAASQHVQEVERRLGLGLFDRSKRPLELTEAGRLYAEFCRDVLRRQEELGLALDTLKADVAGSVRVVSIYSIGLSEMSRLQQEFGALYPNANLDVEYMRPDKIYDAVRNDSADLGLVSYPESSREIAAIPWRDEQMQVAVPPDHPLASREEVLPRDLNGENFIGFDEDLIIRRELDRYLRAQGVEVNLVMHFDNIQMIKEAVALGSGVSILPARTMQAEIAQGRLAAVPLQAPELVRPVGVVHRRRKKLTRAAEAFLELLIPQS